MQKYLRMSEKSSTFGTPLLNSPFTIKGFPRLTGTPSSPKFCS